MVQDNKKDKFTINLPNGDIADEVEQMLEEVVNDTPNDETVDVGRLSDAVFSAMESFGITFEW